MQKLIKGLDELGLTDRDIAEPEYHEDEDGGQLIFRFTDKGQKLIDDYCERMDITFEQLIRLVLFPEEPEHGEGRGF